MNEENTVYIVSLAGTGSVLGVDTNRDNAEKMRLYYQSLGLSAFWSAHQVGKYLVAKVTFEVPK